MTNTTNPNTSITPTTTTTTTTMASSSSSLRRRATVILEESQRQIQETAAKGAISWSEIDKVRFYTIGTGLYSMINIALHPVTVLKIRQQTSSSSSSSSSIFLKQPSSSFRSYYRGLGVVLAMAIPARSVYIGVLEASKEGLGESLTKLMAAMVSGPEESHVMVLATSISSGMAGGIAALASQSLVVPMDVISQKQMVMTDKVYQTQGKAIQVIQSILETEGYKGLFRGFGLSLLSSLPTGSIWWAVYGGCQQKFASTEVVHDNNDSYDYYNYYTRLLQSAGIQIVSGLSAAVVASTCTQPIDVIKTRLQVSAGTTTTTTAAGGGVTTYRSVARELYKTAGVFGFFKGTVPRIAHMGLWGIILSSAYEYLKHLSRK